MSLEEARRMLCSGLASYSTHARRTRLYDVCHPYLCETVDGEDSSFRRRACLSAVVTRLMTIDTLLAFPGARIPATTDEKVAYCTTEIRVPVRNLPGRWQPRDMIRDREAGRSISDRTPMLIDQSDGSVSLVYVQGPATSVAGWRTWLERYTSLLACLPAARVVYATVDPDGFRAAAFP
jgi:hypothetical protein